MSGITLKEIRELLKTHIQKNICKIEKSNAKESENIDFIFLPDFDEEQENQKKVIPFLNSINLNNYNLYVEGEVGEISIFENQIYLVSNENKEPLFKQYSIIQNSSEVKKLIEEKKVKIIFNESQDLMNSQIKTSRKYKSAVVLGKNTKECMQDLRNVAKDRSKYAFSKLGEENKLSIQFIGYRHIKDMEKLIGDEKYLILGIKPYFLRNQTFFNPKKY